jgi:hypothetical protein
MRTSSGSCSTARRAITSAAPRSGPLPHEPGEHASRPIAGEPLSIYRDRTRSNRAALAPDRTGHSGPAATGTATANTGLSAELSRTRSRRRRFAAPRPALPARRSGLGEAPRRAPAPSYARGRHLSAYSNRRTGKELHRARLPRHRLSGSRPPRQGRPSGPSLSRSATPTHDPATAPTEPGTCEEDGPH